MTKINEWHIGWLEKSTDNLVMEPNITDIDNVTLMSLGFIPVYAVIPEGEREEVDAELCPEISTIEGDAHTTEFASAHDKGFCLYADSLGRYRLAWPDNSDQPLDGWVRFVATGKRGKKARS